MCVAVDDVTRLAYVSQAFAKACRTLGLRHIRTRPYTPRTNGKAERFIQILYREWPYSMPLQNFEEGNRWLPRCLSIYNRLRKRSSLGWRSPQQRLLSCSADEPGERQHLVP